MEKIKVIVKIDEDGDFIAFFPGAPVNRYNIACWQVIGEHGEASLDYYWQCKKPGKDKMEEVKKFMRIYENNYSGINGEHFKLHRIYRLSYKDRMAAWER